MKKFYVGVKAVIKDERGYLLIKTNEERGSRWEVPGGRIDGNETIEQAATREVFEELPGAELKSIEGLLGATRIQKDIDGDVSLVLVFLLAEADLPDEIRLSDEHVDHMWVNKTENIPEGVNAEIKKILEQLML